MKRGQCHIFEIIFWTYWVKNIQLVIKYIIKIILPIYFYFFNVAARKDKVIYAASIYFYYF